MVADSYQAFSIPVSGTFHFEDIKEGGLKIEQAHWRVYALSGLEIGPSAIRGTRTESS